jgi:hypothetical protein
MNVLIAAHPTRRRGVNRIRRTIGHATAVYDPDPAHTASAIRTYAHTLTHALPGQATLILQDDAIPHPDIRTYAHRANTSHPDALIALYVGSIHAGGPVILKAARRGHRYATLPLGHFIPTVALIWPPDAPARFLAWLDQNPRPVERYQDDEAVKEWRRQLRREAPRALASIPSLARHDNGMPSLLNHGHHGHRDALIPWDAWHHPNDWRQSW